MVEEKDGVLREAGLELRHSAPRGSEMGVGDMWAPGLGQLDGSQGSQGLWPPSLGTPGVRGQ